jgi:predicted amidohydrolase
MEKLTVACAQQQMRLFDSVESYRKELNRFFYMAQAKGARLIVFPALTGVMAASPLVEGFRMGLLRRAEEARRSSSLWTRSRSAITGGAASLLGASFRRALIQALETNPGAIVAAYETTFGDLARAYEMTVVAGTAYLPDAGGAVRHRATVFGPDGAVLGRHDAMALAADEEGLVMAGATPKVIVTPVGRLGMLVGEEAAYPEMGRILTYGGADLLVALAATTQEGLAAYVRAGALARSQENQCFALASFLVGKNHLAGTEESGGEFVGRSGIYAPPELTPRYTGALVEIGTANAEGLLTAELDFDRLAEARTRGALPLRRRMPAGLFASYLPALYGSRRTLADTWPEEASAAPALPARMTAEEPLNQPGQGHDLAPAP